MTIYHFRVLATGISLDGKVWREGSVGKSRDSIVARDADAQVAQYGVQFFEIITPEDYEKLANAVPAQMKPAAAPANSRVAKKKASTAKKAAVKKTSGKITAKTKTSSAAPSVTVEGAGNSTHTPPSEYEGVDADGNPTVAPIANYEELPLETLVMIVATMGDGGAEQVLAYERATLNRPEFVKALETGEI